MPPNKVYGSPQRPQCRGVHRFRPTRRAGLTPAECRRDHRTRPDGDMDLNVGVQQSRKRDVRLRASGKDSELVVYESLEHSLIDSNARALMLDRIAAFLAKHVDH